MLEALESIDDDLGRANITFVKIDDEGSEHQFAVTDLPSLVYIQNGIPAVLGGDLTDVKSVLRSVLKEAKTTRVRSVSDVVLSRLVGKFEHLAAIFHTSADDSVSKTRSLHPLAELCRDQGIAVVKIHDEEEVIEENRG